VPELADQHLSSTPLDDALQGVELAVIVTAHPTVDHQAVVDRSPLVLDLRGVTRGLERSHVLQL
jgi:UDP-N-acetyl-D-glucosamine dehydrogenase